MPRKPDFPCPGCGGMMWRGKGSASPEARLCHPCRRARKVGLSVPELEALRYQARKESLPSRSCGWCTTEFRSTTSDVRCCSGRCAQLLRNAEGRGYRVYQTADEQRAARVERWQKKNRRRRALKRGARSEVYSLEEIASRDEFRCGICSDEVDMALRCPDRGAPTIDHVVPIAAGGDDLRENVQLAHFACNSRKGARVA